MTMHSVFIFLQSGETLVSVSSPVVRLEQTLLTGLLTAIREFGHEAIKEEIRTIGAGQYRFYYDVLNRLVTVGLADSNADELEVQAVLHSLNVLFFNQYETLLKKWNGDVKPFQNFLPVIHEALRAHNELSQVAKKRISSTEHLLTTLGDSLDTVLLNLLVGNAVIFTSPNNNTIEEVSKSLDAVLPFSIPNMHGITDVETATDILESRRDQQKKHPTLLGVTSDVYRALTTPENLEKYVFVNLIKDPVYLAPSNQPNMDLTKQALQMGNTSALQAKLLELQLEMLRAQLTSFIKFRRSAQHFTLEDLRSLLHYDSERFRLLAYLSQESILNSIPEETTTEDKGSERAPSEEA